MGLLCGLILFTREQYCAGAYKALVNEHKVKFSLYILIPHSQTAILLNNNNKYNQQQQLPTMAAQKGSVQLVNDSSRKCQPEKQHHEGKEPQQPPTRLQQTLLVLAFQPVNVELPHSRHR